MWRRAGEVPASEEEKTRVRALLSVANRDGIVSLARELLALEVEVFATDGTRDHLAADGIEVRPVSELTGLPTLDRRPGQDLPPGDLRRASSPAATSPPRWTS